MKTYIAEELKEILELHNKWLNNEDGGVRADLSYANLRSADLSYANLRSANLSYANLRSADLSYADLSYANLRSANLSYANLRSADLSYANLRSAIGEMTFIKSLQCEKYLISYTVNFLNIGCQSYTIEEWKNFDDEKIKGMDSGALEWWTKWKPIILQIIEMSPAKEQEEKEDE